jgi:anti-sigma factor (TIGR02949 family)
MISCSEAVKQLWDYLEHDVTTRERDAVEEHLAFCRRCCGEMEFADELRGLLSSAAEAELPPDVERRLSRTLDDLGDETPIRTTQGDPR